VAVVVTPWAVAAVASEAVPWVAVDIEAAR
jgi:hypothetical protein